tara:strand:- start:866 stop:1183 length:318 start_codon:yes stop_codon:yes gene_type:complete
MVNGNSLFTPKDFTVLNGITRQTIMKIAKDLNYDVIEKNISVEEAKMSEEAFFTGTAAEVTPIIQIDDVEINRGVPGTFTKKIQEIYFNVIRGRISEYNNWLTQV